MPNPPQDKIYIFAEDDGEGNTVLKQKNSAGESSVIGGGGEEGSRPAYFAGPIGANIDADAGSIQFLTHVSGVSFNGAIIGGNIGDRILVSIQMGVGAAISISNFLSILS